MVSDNASNFTFIEKLIGKVVCINDPILKEYVQSKQILWYFIPTYSPWYGGVYESMVGVVKRCLERSF